MTRQAIANQPIRKRTKRIRIPDRLDWLALVNGLIAELTTIYDWYGTVEDRRAAALIGTEIYGSYQELNPEVGTIVASVFAILPDGLLPCLGQTLLKDDYPELWDIFSRNGVATSTTFTMPDLRGHWLVGSGRAIDGQLPVLGSEFGEESHALEFGNLPAHSHGIPPHSHGYTSAVSTLINGGIEAPASAAQPFPATTTPVSVSTDTQGMNAPFPIAPLSIAVKWCMIAW